MRNPDGATQTRLRQPHQGWSGLDLIAGHPASADVLLAGVLAVLCVAILAPFGQPYALGLDLLMCAGAILAAWRPQVGVPVLAVGLACYLLIPLGWKTLGEYAPLITILGAGMRQRSRLRIATTILFGALLVALVYRETNGGSLFVGGVVAWAGLIAVVWLIGSVFAAAVRAREERTRAAFLADRQALARELHDTAARTLTLTSLRAQKLYANHPTPEFEAVIDGLELANQQLRWALRLLQTSTVDDALPPTTARSAPLEEALQSGVAVLKTHGFAPSVTVDGDLAAVEPRRATALASATNEAVANIVRHGDPSQPSSIIASVEPHSVELVFINHPSGTETAVGDSHPMGLATTRDRLRPFGGQLDTQDAPNSWLTRILMPLEQAPNSRQGEDA